MLVIQAMHNQNTLQLLLWLQVQVNPACEWRQILLKASFKQSSCLSVVTCTCGPKCLVPKCPCSLLVNVRADVCLGVGCRHGRKFQFFCKYYVAMAGSLCGCIILSEDVPAIRQWSPLYVMITVIVVMSEKVDTTITKGKSCNAMVHLVSEIIP